MTANYYKTFGVDPDDRAEIPPMDDATGFKARDEQARKAREKIDAAIPGKVDINTLFDDVTLTCKDTEKMANAEFIIDNLIVRGHVHYIAAPGNGGKTTIFVHLCPEMVASGYSVFYINVDGNPDDLKRHQKHADEHGYRVICPDAKGSGKSVDDVMIKLEKLAESDVDLSSTIFIFDTLKKFLDVINKAQAKRFNTLMRALSQKGMTIILLGHTNKHKDVDGKLVYEGTSDMRSDVDNLIYFNSSLNEQERILDVTTYPDKVRANFEPRSFRIHLKDDRRVEEVGYVLTILSPEVRQMTPIFKEGIIAGMHMQKDLIEFAKERCEYGDKKLWKLLQVIDRIHQSPIRKRKTGNGKELHYYLTEEALEETIHKGTRVH